MNVFTVLKYTGKGKLYCGSINIYYEGGWLRGKFHGDNIYVNGIVQMTGIWENGIITEAVIITEKSTYRGQILHCLVPHGIGKKEWLVSDGVKMVYEGEFHNGSIHGKGKLYNDGLLIRDGRFEMQEEID